LGAHCPKLLKLVAAWGPLRLAYYVLAPAAAQSRMTGIRHAPTPYGVPCTALPFHRGTTPFPCALKQPRQQAQCFGRQNPISAHLDTWCAGRPKKKPASGSELFGVLINHIGFFPPTHSQMTEVADKRAWAYGTPEA